MRYTKEQLEALAKVCHEWQERYGVDCPEAIYQVDAVNESLPDLVDEIGVALGWWTKA